MTNFHITWNAFNQPAKANKYLDYSTIQSGVFRFLSEPEDGKVLP